MCVKFEMTDLYAVQWITTILCICIALFSTISQGSVSEYYMGIFINILVLTLIFIIIQCEYSARVNRLLLWMLYFEFIVPLYLININIYSSSARQDNYIVFFCLLVLPFTLNFIAIFTNTLVYFVYEA